MSVSDFRQKKIEEYKGGAIESKPEVKIKKPKPASLEEQQKKRLSEIIIEVNALYDKDYEPDFTTKAALQIRDLLLKNPAIRERLEKSARTNELKEFRFTYDDCVQEVLIEGFDQNVDFYTLLLSNEEVRKKFAAVFLREIYSLFRQNRGDASEETQDYLVELDDDIKEE
jgi:type I restriction enzyme R subunit